MLKKAADESVRAYKHTEMDSRDQWLPTFSEKLLAQARQLKYISLADIKKCKTPCKEYGAKKNFELFKQLLDEDGDFEKPESAIAWPEWVPLFADLIALYIEAGHPIEVIQPMFIYYRLLMHFGNAKITHGNHSSRLMCI